MKSNYQPSQKVQLVEDRHSRINMKSKRKKTIVKKLIEFSKMFDFDILLIIHDKEMSKLYEYNSGTEEQGLFTIDRAKNVRELTINTK